MSGREKSAPDRDLIVVGGGPAGSTLAALVSGLQRFRPLSPFWWYSGNDPLHRGLEPLHIALLVGTTLVCIATAVLVFQRRDVA